MNKDCQKVDDILIPGLLAVEENFLVAYKPPRMHSAPRSLSSGDNLLEFCAGYFPEIMDLQGRMPGDGGLLHRLDFETHGLLLVARTTPGMEALLRLQDEGKIVKEYSAIAMKTVSAQQGFPPEGPKIPALLPSGYLSGDADKLKVAGQFIIESAFRPYGKGRKAVRPVALGDGNGIFPGKARKTHDIARDRGRPYLTEILRMGNPELHLCPISLRIYRGFRHQIRSHLAWMKMPILNDNLYGGNPYGKGLLALRACSIAFNDPFTGRNRLFSIDSLEPQAL